jgi:hypothetical protein
MTKIYIEGSSSGTWLRTKEDIMCDISKEEWEENFESAEDYFDSLLDNEDTAYALGEANLDTLDEETIRKVVEEGKIKL